MAKESITNFEALASLSETAQDELIHAMLVRAKFEAEREQNRVIEILPEAQAVYDDFAQHRGEALAMESALSVYKTAVQNPQITQPEIISKVVDQIMETEPFNQLDNPQTFRTVITSVAEQLVPELRIEEGLKQLNHAVVMAHERGLKPAELFLDRDTYLELTRQSSTPEEVRDRHLRYLRTFSRWHFQTAELMRGVFKSVGGEFDEDDEANLEKLRGVLPAAPKDFLGAYVQMVNEELAEIWGPQNPALTH